MLSKWLKNASKVLRSHVIHVVFENLAIAKTIEEPCARNLKVLMIESFWDFANFMAESVFNLNTSTL